MTVHHELARLCTAVADAKTEAHVVKTPFQKLEQVFARFTLHFFCDIKIFSKLAFQNAICTFNLLDVYKRQDYDDVVSRIDMRSIFRLVLSVKDIGNFACQSAEYLSLSIDNIPLLLHFAGFRHICFH